MSERTHRLLLAALFITLLFLTAFSYRFIPDFGHPLIGKRDLLPPADVERTGLIEITSPRDAFPIVLERKEQSWELVLDSESRYPADGMRVERFLNALAEKVSVKPLGSAKLQAYGTSGAESFSVRILGRNGKLLLDINTGNVSAAGTFIYYFDNLDGLFSRREDGISAFLDTRTSLWADLAPFDALLSGKEIERIEYKRNGTSLELVRGIDAESGRVDAFLDEFQRRLESLRVADITNIPVIPEALLQIEFGDGSTLHIGLTQAIGRYCILKDYSSGATWIIESQTRDLLLQLP